MGGDPQQGTGAGNGGGVGAVQILLPEVDEIDALIERRLPMIVDHQLRAVAGAHGLGGGDLAGHVLGRALETQLHQAQALRHQPGDHRRIGQDGIHARQPHVRPRRPRSAMPSTGVEGAAMSRGGISPAS